ncbi:hypothetical protein [Aureimonas ureilytica]|uniref:hypothetical protein n=1 Tax=Aureimonas ureilytica TaxID=401562 RepID=UPI00036E4087|nr:hypothetical protein [Aureimonas ureilytica]
MNHRGRHDAERPAPADRPGGGMTVHRAGAAFERFCGRAPDAARLCRQFADPCRAG